MKRTVRVIVIMLLFVSVICDVDASLFNSGDITFSLEQSDYYFKTGENAVVNLDSDNSYGQPISGTLSYTLTQSVNQGSFQYSSSNTKSTSFSVKDGKTKIPLGFGTSDTPLTLTVDLKFSYNKDEDREVALNGLKIHFVDDNTQKNSQQNSQRNNQQNSQNNPLSSSSQKAQQNSQQNQQQNDPFSQQQKQMQQMINQMTGNQQANQPQNSQQALQNNQMNQDSSALKQQIQQQLQQQQQLKQEFQKTLSQNPQFQKEHQDLLKQGYNLTSANVNPSSKDTGNFQMNYQKPNGEKASLKGNMENGEMKDMQKDTAESRQQIMDKLQQDKSFKKYEDKLQQQGFSRKDTAVSPQQNKTTVQVNYADKNNNTADIKADVINDTVENVKLTQQNDKKNNFWKILLWGLIIIVLGYFAYKKLMVKFRKKKTIEPESPSKPVKPFDHKKEALSMLERSKELFAGKDYKEAYGRAGQALRLYLSYENHLRKEVTNDEIIDYLRKHKKSHLDAKECFDLCSLVEFAKYEANKKDFDKILKYAEKIIG